MNDDIDKFCDALRGRYKVCSECYRVLNPEIAVSTDIEEIAGEYYLIEDDGGHEYDLCNYCGTAEQDWLESEEYRAESEAIRREEERAWEEMGIKW